MKNLKKNENVLICKKVKYYSRKDEDAFFEWIKKIDCIDNFIGSGNELYLYISSHDLHDYDLRDLLALFYRYKIDMKQLRVFLNKDNRDWFYENKKAYWHKKIFEKET